MPQEIILYSYFRSSCAWRVRIALEWKCINYECRYINLFQDGGQQNSDIYKAVNPMAQVPSLVVGNVCLTQSIAILEYLEETFPSKPLLPENIMDRFKVREISEIVASGIQPMQNLSVLNQFEGNKGNEWAAKWITKGLIALEKIISASSGKYCVGDQVTFADCCLVPQLYSARRWHVDLEPFPTLIRVEKNLSILEPFIKAHANRQPDCPPEFST